MAQQQQQYWLIIFRVENSFIFEYLTGTRNYVSYYANRDCRNVFQIIPISAKVYFDAIDDCRVDEYSNVHHIHELTC